MFKQMKIEINNCQTLNDVKKELFRLGFWWFEVEHNEPIMSVLCFDDGYCDFRVVEQEKYTTTLNELKEMS